jgi:hypothetical protein
MTQTELVRFQVEWLPAPLATSAGGKVEPRRWLVLMDALSPASAFIAQDLTAELASEPRTTVKVVDAPTGANFRAMLQGEITGVVWLVPLAHVPPPGSLSGRTVVQRCAYWPHPHTSPPIGVGPAGLKIRLLWQILSDHLQGVSRAIQ